MSRTLSPRKLGVAAGIASVAIGGVVAFAYFTTSGSGTATGAVGTSSNLVLHGVLSGGASDGNFYPGGPARTVTFTVDNGSSGNQVLSVIHLQSVSAYTDSTKATSVAGCGSADFSMADVTVNKDYAPGSGQSVTPTGSISMLDTGVNQDACKTAYLVFNFTSADPGSSFAPSPAIPTP